MNKEGAVFADAPECCVAHVKISRAGIQPFFMGEHRRTRLLSLFFITVKKIIFRYIFSCPSNMNEIQGFASSPRVLSAPLSFSGRAEMRGAANGMGGGARSAAASICAIIFNNYQFTIVSDSKVLYHTQSGLTELDNKTIM